MKNRILILFIVLFAIEVTAQRKTVTDKIQVTSIKNAEILKTDSKGNIIKGKLPEAPEVDLSNYLEKGSFTETLNNIQSERAQSLIEIKDDLNRKVDKEEGKGLSSNDFTNELKNKLEELKNGVAAGEDKNGIYSGSGEVDSNTDIIFKSSYNEETDGYLGLKKQIYKPDGTIAEGCYLDGLTLSGKYGYVNVNKDFSKLGYCYEDENKTLYNGLEVNRNSAILQVSSNSRRTNQARIEIESDEETVSEIRMSADYISFDGTLSFSRDPVFVEDYKYVLGVAEGGSVSSVKPDFKNLSLNNITDFFSGLKFLDFSEYKDNPVPGYFLSLKNGEVGILFNSEAGFGGDGATMYVLINNEWFAIQAERAERFEIFN